MKQKCCFQGDHIAKTSKRYICPLFVRIMFNMKNTKNNYFRLVDLKNSKVREMQNSSEDGKKIFLTFFDQRGDPYQEN